MPHDSAMLALRDLRLLEDERVEVERRAIEEARARDAALIAERARASAADQAARELAERIARIDAELALERERHATERARLAVELAQARGAAPAAIVAPAPRWPILAAASLAVGALALALWLDGRLDAAQRRADAAIEALSARMDDMTIVRQATPAPTLTPAIVVEETGAPAPVTPAPRPNVAPRPSRPARPATPLTKPTFDVDRCKDLPLGCMPER